MAVRRSSLFCATCLALAWFVSVPAAETASTCPSVDGLKPLLSAGDVIVLGEMHGTAQSPAFVLDIACHARQAGLPLVVGLELGETEEIRTFLGSKATAEDRAALLGGARWQSTYQDGRNSKAMLDLLDGLRAMGARSDDLEVLLFDAGGGQRRDQLMADNVKAVLPKSEDKLVVLLTGNVHSRFRKGSRFSREFEPMAYLVGKSLPQGRRMTSLDVAYANGTAWICAPDCGEAQLRGQGPEGLEGIKIDSWAERTGHHGWYGVGAIEASPPAARSEP